MNAPIRQALAPSGGLRAARRALQGRKGYLGAAAPALPDPAAVAAAANAASANVSTWFQNVYGGDTNAAPPTCPAGTVLNPFTGGCVDPATLLSCPQGQFPLPGGGCGALPIDLPYGTIPLPGFPPAVPPGTVPNTAGCPPGFTRGPNGCVCPAGFGLSDDGKTCIPIGGKGYPAGGNPNDTVSCDVIGSDGYCYTGCPAGYQWDPATLSCLAVGPKITPTPPPPPPAAAAGMSTGAKVLVGLGVVTAIGLAAAALVKNRHPSRIVRTT